MINNLYKTLIIWVIHFVLISNTNINAQEPQSTWLNLTYNGFLPKVFDIKDKTTAELYNKAVEWANSFYPNIKNDLIFDSTNYQLKIRTIKTEAFYIGLKRNLYDVDYTLTISFKDQKYRVQVDLNTFYYNPRNTKYRSGGEPQETGWDQREFYLSEKEIDPKNSLAYSELYFAMYEVSTSLFQAMNSKTFVIEKQKNDDW
ncbi:MAG: DUF4468 domain-containing protein [Crocinitomicaceae bacterium]|nr:DUF4468 domain-containing protein [Crocinitomicaceae bacterium]